MFRYILFCFLLSVALLQPAQADESGFFSIQLENDLLGSHNDRFYTHGSKFSFTYTDSPPQWLQSMVDRLPFYTSAGLVIHGYEFGQTIFTPEDISELSLIKDDRPYAGWLYFNAGIGHLYEDKGDQEKINFFMLTLGMVGPYSFSEVNQKLIHGISESDTPKGWNNQLHNELGINVSYLHKWRKIFDFNEPLQTEFSYHAGVTLGNVYSFAASGIMFRYGTFLKADIGPPTILPGFTGAPAFNPDQRPNWYVFGGMEVRAMARNIFLDGNTFMDSHSVDKKPVVADIQLGVAFRFDDMRVSFMQMLRSKEFEGQQGSSQFGAINLTFYTE